AWPHSGRLRSRLASRCYCFVTRSLHVPDARRDTMRRLRPENPFLVEAVMKRTLTSAALALGTAALGAWLWRDLAWGQDRAEAADKDKDKHTLNTSGTASIRVKPDSARVFFRVETYAAKIDGARAENNRVTREIL